MVFLNRIARTTSHFYLVHRLAAEAYDSIVMFSNMISTLPTVEYDDGPATMSPNGIVLTWESPQSLHQPYPSGVLLDGPSLYSMPTETDRFAVFMNRWLEPESTDSMDRGKHMHPGDPFFCVHVGEIDYIQPQTLVHNPVYLPGPKKYQSGGKLPECLLSQHLKIFRTGLNYNIEGLFFPKLWALLPIKLV